MERWIFDLFFGAAIVFGVLGISIGLWQGRQIRRKSVVLVMDYLDDLVGNLIKSLMFYRLHNGGEDPNEPMDELEYRDYLVNCNFFRRFSK